MNLKKWLAPVLVGILAIGIAGCGTDSSSKEIRIGATAGPHAEVVEAVAKEAAKEGNQCKSCGIFRLCNTGQSVG